MREEVSFNRCFWYDEVMINETSAKKYCSEDISLIENYHKAIADKEKMWDIHHRMECDENGKTIFTHKQLKEMNLYFKRPAEELIFVTRSMHWKLHREMSVKGGKILNEKLTFEQRSKGGKIGGKSQSKIEKQSITILQFSKDMEFIKEWQSASEAGRKLGIVHQHICACCKGKLKSAGGYRWTYKDPR